MGLKWTLLALHPLLLGYGICSQYKKINKSKWALALSIFLIILAPMNVSFIIKVKILELMKWSYRSPLPPTMLIVQPRIINEFWAHSPISVIHIVFFVSGFTFDYTPLNSNTSVWVRNVTRWGPRSLTLSVPRDHSVVATPFIQPL